jgi:hypothetical protein
MPLVVPNSLVKPTRPPHDEDTILHNGTRSLNYLDKLELAGAQGHLRQKGAVRKVMLLNWRGIVHTTLTMIITNYVFLQMSFALTLVNFYMAINAKIRAAKF